MIDISKLLSAIAIIAIIILLSIILGGCAATSKEHVVYNKPVVVSNTHTVQKKLILPKAPICNVDDALLDVTWYRLVTTDNNTHEDLYIAKLADVHSLSYNISELRSCLKRYLEYINTINNVVNKYNKNSSTMDNKRPIENLGSSTGLHNSTGLNNSTGLSNK